MAFSQRELRLLAIEIVKEYMRYEVVGIKETSQILGIAESTIYNKIDRIPHGRFEGGRLRFFKADLIKLISK